MDSVPFCVSKDTFYEKLDALKGSKKSNSKLTVFIDDEFYENAKNWTIQNDNILSKDRKIVYILYSST